jgi:hypothetical protein
MAAKPTKPKTTAVAVKPPANLVSIQDALKAQVAAMDSRIVPPTGATIRATTDKKIVLPDGTKTEGPLNLVIVDFVATNAFYPKPFDRNAIVPPDCYAAGENPKTLAPAKNAPNPQAKTCAECPRAAWGSAIHGNPKGKACNNERLMAVLPPDSTPETDMWLLKASRTAVGNFDTYIAEIKRTYQAAPIQMITEVALNDAETYPQFNFSNPQPNPNFAAQFARQGEARAMLMAERDVSGWVPETTAPKKTARR